MCKTPRVFILAAALCGGALFPAGPASAQAFQTGRELTQGNKMPGGPSQDSPRLIDPAERVRNIDPPSRPSNPSPPPSQQDGGSGGGGKPFAG